MWRNELSFQEYICHLDEIFAVIDSWNICFLYNDQTYLHRQSVEAMELLEVRSLSENPIYIRKNEKKTFRIEGDNLVLLTEAPSMINIE